MPVRKKRKSDKASTPQPEYRVLPIGFRKPKVPGKSPYRVVEVHQGATGNEQFDALWAEAMRRAPRLPAEIGDAESREHYRRMWAWHWLHDQVYKRKFDADLVLPFTTESHRAYEYWLNHGGWEKLLWHTILEMEPDAQHGRKFKTGRPQRKSYRDVVEVFKSVRDEGKAIGKTAQVYETAKRLSEPNNPYPVENVWKALRKHADLLSESFGQ